MNRTIRFRAWMGDIETMFEEGDDDLRAFFNALHPMTSDTVLMQYTGLEAEHGVEIYEGDVLGAVCINGSIANAEVLFWGGAFYAKHRTAERLATILIDVADTVKVIGNIYENPELLKEQS